MGIKIEFPFKIARIKDKIRTSSVLYTFDIAKGNVPDHFSMNKFGHNEDVAASFETVWSAGGIYPYMTSADQLEIVSSNDEDGGAGTDTGALTMDILGLDANYNELFERVTLNGTTVVTTTQSFLRVYRAIVRTAGSTGWNIGTITIRDQDTDTTRALIEPFFNQTTMAVFTVPVGFRGFITSWYCGAIANKDTEIHLLVRPFEEVFQVKRIFHIIGASYGERFDFPEVVEEKGDIEMRAKASAGGGDVATGFFMWYERMKP